MAMELEATWGEDLGKRSVIEWALAWVQLRESMSECLWGLKMGLGWVWLKVKKTAAELAKRWAAVREAERASLMAAVWALAWGAVTAKEMVDVWVDSLVRKSACWSASL